MTEPYIIQIEENNNVVTIDEENPNIVYVSTTGSPGPRGKSLVSGSGAPTAGVGLTGDIYVDIDTGAFWGPKEIAGWPAEPFYVAANTQRFVFTQASPSDTWVINHTLGGRPSVTVVDSASTTVIGEVSYISDSQVEVSFTSPFSGFAYLT